MLEAVYNILTNASAVTTYTSTRIYPARIPIDVAYPAISFHLISDVPENQKTGRAQYFNARIQVNCFSTSPMQAINMSRAVRNALERKTRGVYGGIAVINITHLGDMMRQDDSSDFDGVFYVICEFNICHGSTS